MSITDTIDDALDRTVLLSFTNLGYRLRQGRWGPLDVSMDGKTVVVTGATSGLGKSAASGLARLGARVVLVGRNPSKAEDVRREIAGATGNDDLTIEIADLSLMSEIRALAERLLAGGEPIHVLVNNAGVLQRAAGHRRGNRVIAAAIGEWETRL